MEIYFTTADTNIEIPLNAKINMLFYTPYGSVKLIEYLGNGYFKAQNEYTTTEIDIFSLYSTLNLDNDNCIGLKEHHYRQLGILLAPKLDDFDYSLISKVLKYPMYNGKDFYYFKDLGDSFTDKGVTSSVLDHVNAKRLFAVSIHAAVDNPFCFSIVEKASALNSELKPSKIYRR